MLLKRRQYYHINLFIILYTSTILTPLFSNLLDKVSIAWLYVEYVYY